MRPPSILLFERLYLAGLIVSIVAAAFNWSNDMANVLANPGVAGIAGADRIVPGIYLVLRVAIWAGWALLLFLVARRGSRPAKWLVVIGAVLLAIDGANTLLAVLGGPLAGWSATMAIVEAVLVIAAAAMLFRRDALPWFAGKRTDAGA